MLYLSTVQIEISVRTLITISADDVWLTTAIPGVSVADGEEVVLIQVGSNGVALAGLATWGVSGLFQGQSIAKEPRFAALTIESVRIVNAPSIIEEEKNSYRNVVGTFLVRLFP